MPPEHNAALSAAGFAPDEAARAAYERFASGQGMNTGGPYTVLAVWRKGAVTLVFEQNTSIEPTTNGLTTSISHPPVCVVTTPAGSVSCNADDLTLILHLAGEETPA